MHIETLVVGPLQENCHIIADSNPGPAAVIDPGDDADLILEHISDKNYQVSHILLTHAHFDHVSAVAAVQRATGASICLHRAEKLILDNLALQTAYFGFPTPESFTVDRWLEDGDIIAIGLLNVTVLHTPGHSPGGVCYYHDGYLFSGDALFYESIGRTDLPGGSADQLLASIRTQLYPLPGDTRVYPGHGPVTTIAYEQQNNPFLQ